MILFFVNTQANPDNVFIPHHMKSEKTLRRELYRVYEANPYFYKMTTCDFFKDIDYYIQVLKDNLKKRHGKIAHGRTFFDSNKFKYGLINSFLSVFFCSFSCFTVKTQFFEWNSDLVAIWGVMAAIPFGIAAIAFLSKMNNYSQRKIDHLERAKRLIAIFEMEKRKQQEKKVS